jgi:hypothetical protein
MAKDPNFPMQGKLGGMGGQYGRKAENLTKKQLKRSGALKASKKFTIDITQTRRVEGSGVTLGPKGKPLTGSVKLANGKIAVYKAGKRVVNKPVSKDKPKLPPPPPKTRKTTMIQSSMVKRKEKESVSSYKNSKPTKPYGRTGNAY